MPVKEVFAEFDWEPLAAASIGQTYRARLRSAEAVVAKVQRPGIHDVILSLIGFAFLSVSAVLLVAGDEGPAVATGTGLFEVRWYGGLLAGTVLLLREAAAIARDGTT